MLSRSVQLSDDGTKQYRTSVGTTVGRAYHEVKTQCIRTQRAEDEERSVVTDDASITTVNATKTDEPGNQKRKYQLALRYPK